MIDMRIRRLFFDRATVIRAVDKARRKALSKAGAFIMTTARHSIRSRKGSAPPGQPPHSKTGLLRRFIFFGYDPSTESVVVGPARLNRSSGAPHILEFGGFTTVESFRRGRVRRRRVKIEARPYMGPALEKERPRLPEPWAASIRA